MGVKAVDLGVKSSLKATAPTERRWAGKIHWGMDSLGGILLESGRQNSWVLEFASTHHHGVGCLEFISSARGTLAQNVGTKCAAGTRLP